MNNLLLPDFFAMALLVCVLLAVRGNQERASMRLWIAGLMLILLECASRIIYTVHTGLLVHRLTHALALDCYFVAGAMFVRSASSAIQKMRRSTLFFYLNVAPFVALLTVYGFDNRSAWTYRALVVAGLGIGLTSSAFFKRRWYFYGAFLLIWTPVLICSSIQQFRSAIYFSLAFLYILAGVAFYGFLPAGSRGKIAIVAGFSMWSLCFLTHPWIAAAHPSWGPFANEVWNMQKFIITVGLLLSLLERQVRSNEWLALHDELTSLPNRRLFDDRLQHALFRAERDGQRVAIFNIDLDGFKNINDTLGHHAGDLLLRGVAQHLLGATRRTDTLARLGGDEFSLIAVDLGMDPGHTGESKHPLHLPQTQRIFTLLLHAVEQPVRLGDGYGDATAEVSGSIGVAVFPDDGREAPALLRLADQRMYSQKADRARLRKSGEHTSASRLQTA